MIVVAIMTQQGDETFHASQKKPESMPMSVDDLEEDTDDPLRTVPLTRYNAMLAVVRNTLFMCVKSSDPRLLTPDTLQLRRHL